MSELKKGIVLSGGGSRTAYQVGALRAIAEHLPQYDHSIAVVVGSSLGAINGIMLGSLLDSGLSGAIETLTTIWRERTFKNTFHGSPSRAFMKAIQVAFLQYTAPGPKSLGVSIFDPTPLRTRLDAIISAHDGCNVRTKSGPLEAVGVMTTVDGAARKPLLIVNSRSRYEESRFVRANFSVRYIDAMTASFGLASAALPSILPPVKIDLDDGEMHLVDGGICDNVPIDPAVRLGAEDLISIDSSGRSWWFDHYGEPHDTRPTWEVPALEETYCHYPLRFMEIKNKAAFGPLLRDACGRSLTDFISALGPTWPIFKILKHKIGEDLAYEVMSYCALHPAYFDAMIEQGYKEARKVIEARKAPIEPIAEFA